jgi:hypothetical protein
VQENRKSLLVRADFVLGHSQPGDRRTYKRWRGILHEVLPRLMGCERRSARAEKVRLRSVEDHPLYSAWIRIPIERRPSKKRLRKLVERLRSRLERNLRLVDGQVVKMRVRRCRKMDTACTVAPVNSVESLPVVSPPVAVGEQVTVQLPLPAAEPSAPVPAHTASVVPAA